MQCIAGVEEPELIYVHTYIYYVSTYYVHIMYLGSHSSDSGAALFNYACFCLGNMLGVEYVCEYMRVLCPHFSGGTPQKRSVG